MKFRLALVALLLAGNLSANSRERGTGDRRRGAAAPTWAEEVQKYIDAGTIGGWYKLDEASGATAADSDGTANDAAYAGGITYQAAALVQGSSFGVTLDGIAGTGIAVPAAALAADQPLTVIVTYYPTNVSASRWLWIQPNNGHGSIRMSRTNAGQLEMYANSGAGDGYNTLGYTAVVNTRQMVAATFLGAAPSAVAKAYVNGDVTNNSVTGTINVHVVAETLNVGNEHAAATSPYIGSVDEIVVIKAALDASQIHDLWVAGQIP